MSYTWVCGWTNGAGDWKDSERCVSASRKTFKTADAARRAADRHERAHGHHGSAGVINLTQRKLHKKLRRAKLRLFG